MKKKLIDLSGLNVFKNKFLIDIQNRLSNYIEKNIYNQEQAEQNDTITSHYSEMQERFNGQQNQLNTNSTAINTITNGQSVESGITDLPGLSQRIENLKVSILNVSKLDIKVDKENGVASNLSLILEKLPDEGINTDFVAFNNVGDTNKLYRTSSATIAYSLIEDGTEIDDYNVKNLILNAGYEYENNIYVSKYLYVQDLITERVFKPFFNVVHFPLPLAQANNNTGFKSVYMTLYKLGTYVSLYCFQFLLQENYSNNGNLVYDSPYNGYNFITEALTITKEEFLNNVIKYTRNLPFYNAGISDVYHITSIGSTIQNDCDGVTTATLFVGTTGSPNYKMTIGFQLNANSYNFNDGDNFCLYVLSTSIDHV